jgi:hypothetical protein
MGERVQVGSDIGEERADPVRVPPPIDYSRADSIGDWWRRFAGFFRENIHGAFEFIGEILGIFGGPRRTGFAIAIACLSGGLGACIATWHTSGVFWMTIGGFLLGLYLPMPKKSSTND